MMSLEKSVCFVCWHGVGMSVFCKGYFEDYLKSIGVNNVRCLNAGVEWFEQRYAERIKNSDLIVVTLEKIPEDEVRKKFDSRGKIYYLGTKGPEYKGTRKCNESNPTNKWRESVYEQLLQT